LSQDASDLIGREDSIIKAPSLPYNARSPLAAMTMPPGHNRLSQIKFGGREIGDSGTGGEGQPGSEPRGSTGPSEKREMDFHRGGFNFCDRFQELAYRPGELLIR
jgi:hypothetical protein